MWKAIILLTLTAVINCNGISNPEKQLIPEDISTANKDGGEKTNEKLSTNLQRKATSERTRHQNVELKKIKDHLIEEGAIHVRSQFENFDWTPCSMGIEPCICSQNVTHLLMDCSFIPSLEELKQTLTASTAPPTEVDIFFYISQTPLQSGTTLLSSTFGSFSLREVYIEDTLVQTIEDDAFLGSEDTLTVVAFSGNSYLKEFPFHQLTNFPRLTTLTIENGDLTSLPLLGYLPDLEYFAVVNNELRGISNSAFGQLPSLKAVILTENELTLLPSELLHFEANNILLFLEHNEILDIGSFPNEPPLLLHLMNNNLTEFPQSVFETVLLNIINCNCAAFVDVSYNPIECGGMSWVYNDEQYSKHVISDC